MKTDWKEISSLRIENKDYHGQIVKYKVVLAKNLEFNNPLLALGLNPSGVTDGVKLSQTSSKLVGYAIANGNDAVILFNVCPYTCPDPKGLTEVILDECHERNMEEISKVADLYPTSPVLLCFGHDVEKLNVSRKLSDLLRMFGLEGGRQFFVIDNNGSVNPPHPSRAPGKYLKPIDTIVLSHYVTYLKLVPQHREKRLLKKMLQTLEFKADKTELSVYDIVSESGDVDILNEEYLESLTNAFLYFAERKGQVLEELPDGQSYQEHPWNKPYRYHKAVKSHRIAVRLIYYKAVTPSMDILDLDEETWREFLYADNRSRIETVCSILGNKSLASNVREVAWIPLDDQSRLSEKKYK